MKCKHEWHLVEGLDSGIILDRKNDDMHWFSFICRKCGKYDGLLTDKFIKERNIFWLKFVVNNDLSSRV